MTVVSQYSRRTLLLGAGGGIIAGVLFGLLQILISAAAGQPPLLAFQVISSMVLGGQALTPGYPAGTAMATGIALHLLFSAMYGVAFSMFLAFIRQMGAPGSVVIVLGAIYAGILWIVNFLVFAPLLFPQLGFASSSGVPASFWVGFSTGHIIYGVALGTYVAAARSWRERRPA